MTPPPIEVCLDLLNRPSGNLPRVGSHFQGPNHLHGFRKMAALNYALHLAGWHTVHQTRWLDVGMSHHYVLQGLCIGGQVLGLGGMRGWEEIARSSLEELSRQTQVHGWSLGDPNCESVEASFKTMSERYRRRFDVLVNENLSLIQSYQMDDSTPMAISAYVVRARL